MVVNNLEFFISEGVVAQLEATSVVQAGVITVDSANIRLNDQPAITLETAPGIVEILPLSNGYLDFDGSLGLAFAPSGPDFRINAEYGQLSGSNLFHSFSNFNLTADESATFFGPETVTRIISRITGGNRSSVDGTIRSEIEGADFYFLNPAGFLFGENAVLDTTGSFHVSTADYMRLGDNDLFYSIPSESSVLSALSPAALKRGMSSDRKNAFRLLAPTTSSSVCLGFLNSTTSSPNCD